ncbi:MAG: tRNA (adenosine(37)-N6)-threonylcarbamoyltransferase complex dimerization subunit type 1 TsaB [Paludibacteraceae bacterium]|nr:tRNA (adenosine(37)-N6)-threonylcarbamoyltransferase complex dimerization subunit type 1 TsaB [Paludibacteraceae bacterium]
MTILCIETSTSVCSAAICKDGVPVKQCINYEGSNHARLLPLYIEELLSFAREQALSINAVALSEGPGSYTGLRIGASTAKGLCYGLNVPLIPVPTLDVLCEAVQSKIDNPKSKIDLLPMIDARRMEVYTLLNGETKAVVVENEDSLIANSQEPIANSPIYYFGDGAAKCQQVLTRSNWHFIPNIVPEAQYVGVLAENRKSIIDNRESTDLAYYEPFYLKEFIAAQSHVKGLK